MGLADNLLTQMMNDAYRRDLQRFDTERVLLAWDALIQRQQVALETLGVPTMFATTSQADCQVSMCLLYTVITT
jgi:Na+-transporting NADH:ubiquinone oxidoreductase subunit NqrD